MVHIVCKKGLDLPFPKPKISDKSSALKLKPKRLSIDARAFSSMRLKVCVDVGDKVTRGMPVIVDANKERYLTSHVSGTVVEIQRGLRRAPIQIIVELDNEAEIESPPQNQNLSKESFVEALSKNGFFGDIRQRPFDLPAHPKFLPKSIFIGAHTSAPGTLLIEDCVEGMEKEMRAAVEALDLITPGRVHLVRSKDSKNAFFCDPGPANPHTVQGPHPSGCASLHIEKIDPIQSSEDVVWTLSAKALARLGAWLLNGTFSATTYVHLFDAAFEKSTLIEAPLGASIEELFELAQIPFPENHSLIGGDPLMGTKLEKSDYLPWGVNELYFLPKDDSRKLMHFLRVQADSYSNFRAYFKANRPNFSTNKHGEERAFVDGAIYDRVMPLAIPTMPLVKAVLAEDFEKANELGLLEVASEDFALSAFICPSKIEMVEIIRAGLQKVAAQSIAGSNDA